MDIAISLEQVLESREARAAYQNTLLNGYGLPLISFTVNTPGPQKAGEKPQRIFNAGVLDVRERLAGKILYSKLKDLPTGPEGFFVVEMDAREAKAIACQIEGSHPLGRLMDLDVIDVNRQLISREAIGLPPRGCIVCGKPGPGCARSRAHSLDELYAAIDGILAKWEAAHG